MAYNTKPLLCNLLSRKNVKQKIGNISQPRLMIKRDDKYTIPKGHTKLKEKDKLLVISDNEKELKKTYENLGIDYTIRKN